MTHNHDMGEILAGGAPWEMPALCVECGGEHTAMTWSPSKRDYTGPRLRFGTCQPCITAEQEEYDARQREFLESRKRKEPAVPVLEEAKLKHLDEAIQGDAFDPFKDRKDMF